MRDQLEQPYWQQFEREKHEKRERFVREQELERRRREQETAQQRETRREQREKRQQKKAEEQRKAPKREEATLPNTFEEALSLLHLTAPVTASERYQTGVSHTGISCPPGSRRKPLVN